MFKIKNDDRILIEIIERVLLAVSGGLLGSIRSNSETGYVRSWTFGLLDLFS